MNGPTIGFTNNIATNAIILAKIHGFNELSDVPVHSFTINGKTTIVDEEKYKSALLLFNLSLRANPDGRLNRPFFLTPARCSKIRKFFTPAICREAKNNPEKHSTVFALLQDGEVTVSIQLTPQYQN